jgi:hypothetical protein
MAWPFVSLFASSVIRDPASEPRGAGGSFSSLDNAGLYARSEKAMSSVNVHCGTLTCGPTPVWRPVSDPGGRVHTPIFDADSHRPDTRVAGRFAHRAVPEPMASLPALRQSHRQQEIGRQGPRAQGPKGWIAPGALDAGARSRIFAALEIDAELVRDLRSRPLRVDHGRAPRPGVA